MPAAAPLLSLSASSSSSLLPLHAGAGAASLSGVPGAGAGMGGGVGYYSPSPYTSLAPPTFLSVGLEDDGTVDPNNPSFRHSYQFLDE